MDLNIEMTSGKRVLKHPIKENIIGVTLFYIYSNLQLRLQGKTAPAGSTS
jgi:hypothetical protein